MGVTKTKKKKPETLGRHRARARSHDAISGAQLARSLSNPTSQRYYKALHDYTSEHKKQMSIKKGDILVVESSSKTTSGWMFARKFNNEGTGGWIPSSYCEPTE